MSMTENTVKRYMNEKKTFNVWITIRNLKEESPKAFRTVGRSIFGGGIIGVETRGE